VSDLHLTEAEARDVDAEVVNALNSAFDLAGFKPHLTSLFRTREQGEALGSLPTSAHERGLAADMARPLGVDQAIILAFALGASGFKRFELADKHFHVDLDPTKTSPLIWRGVSK
jgi:hypothetical protein